MKTIWKKLSAGLLAFALVFSTIPPIGASADTIDPGTDTGEKEECDIDVSKAESFSLPMQGVDYVYVLTGTNTSADIYITGDCDIVLDSVRVRTINTNYEGAYTVKITLKGENIIDQNNSQNEAAIGVRNSDVIINGGENDSLHAKSNVFCAYRDRNETGGLTVNGGKITFEGEGGSALATTYTQNGGTVKTINANESSFRFALNLNGGTLEVDHKAANSTIFGGPVKIKNGASMKVTGPKTPGQFFSFNGPIGLADGAAADDCLLVRFDESSDFVYLDEENEILRDKTYAEIKAVTHVHEYENGICSCNYSCVHNTDDGTCGICGMYLYKIKHQPTETEPYVALNDGTGVSYQWYEVKNVREITDKDKTYPWSYVGAPIEENSTYDAACGWTPIPAYGDDGYKRLNYIIAPFAADDKVTLRFSSPVEYAAFKSDGADAKCELDGTTATATIPSDGIYAIYAVTKSTEPTVKVYVGDAEVNALTGQTSATLRQYAYGNYYYCKATAKDGTVLTSDYADFTYKITHQPTDEAQYVSLNNSKNATYQWYVVKEDIVQVIGENSHEWSVFGAPEGIGGTYDNETGWTPDEEGYYFVVWLDEGNTMNLEFSQIPEECFYLFSATEGTVEDPVYFGESLTAPASGYYGIWAEGGGNLKATMDGTEFIAVSGQTDATLNAIDLGKYCCEVTFGNGTKKTSDIVEVQHLHVGGTATCKDKAVCTTCGIGYGPLSTTHDYAAATCTTPKTCKVCGATSGSKLGHTYTNACDKTCNRSGCGATRSITHDYAAATCMTPKTCKVCKTTTGDPLGHSYSSSYTVDKKATTSADGSKSKHCTRSGCSAKKSVTAIPKIKSAKLSYTKTTYSGNAKKPSVTVKDSKGNTLVKDTDYKVTYASGRTKVGRYKVTVTFKGKYSGSKTLYFTIVPKAPSSASAKLYGHDDVKFSWSKVSNASGYNVYYKKSTSSSYTHLKRTTGTSVKKAGLSDGVKYTFKVVPYYKSGDTRYASIKYKTASVYTLKKIGTPTVSKSGTKVKVKWKNISGETGYQISRSTKRTGTNIVSTYKTTSGTYKTVKATKNKTYYYKVRAYKTVDGKKIYGPWSSVKSYKRK